MVGNRALAALQRREAQLQVFAHRQQREHLPALRHECDARPGAIIRRAPVERLPLEGNLPDVSLAWPTIDLIKLVLPTPLRPSTQVILPAPAFSDTPRSACAAP